MRALRETGVTIILTTHYIEEAEEMADRIGVINKGELILVEDKAALMRKLGKKQLTLHLQRAAGRDCRRRSPTAALAAGRGRPRAGLHLRHPGRAHRHHRAAAAPGRGRHRASRTCSTAQSSLEDIFVSLVPSARAGSMNIHGVRAIYRFEMARTRRTLLQSIVSPVISTSLYFVVFGAAIGSRISEIDGVSYGAFIVPGPDHAVAADRRASPTPRSASTFRASPAPSTSCCRRRCRPFEIVLGYVGAAATKSIMLGADHPGHGACCSCRSQIAHPFWMLLFLVLTAVTFSLFGFIIGIWADGFEKLQFVPLLIITPLTFLGGTFYSIDMLPPFWQTVTLFNPVVYLVSGFRWSFYGLADVSVGVSLLMMLVFLAVCLGCVWWIFRTGYRLRS